MTLESFSIGFSKTTTEQQAAGLIRKRLALAYSFPIYAYPHFTTLAVPSDYFLFSSEP